MSTLTTVDNPYDPSTRWREWLAWDRRAGYNTPGLLARVVENAGGDPDDETAIEDAIDRIVALDGLYRKVESTTDEDAAEEEPEDVEIDDEEEDAKRTRSRVFRLLSPAPVVPDPDAVDEREWVEILDEMRAGGVDLDEWGELRAVDGNALKRYWTVGKGLKRWRFHPHPWTRLRNLLTKHVGLARAKRMASEWFHLVFGYWPGSDLHRVGSGRPPRGKRIGPG